MEFSFNREYTTKISTCDQFTALSFDPATSILLYDDCLTQNEGFKDWSQSFPICLPLPAGESLKSLSHFEKVLLQLNEFADKLPLKNLSIIAVGGGSVGDFCGFLASVFKRGIGLIHIPSTWLAAIDSSHGGKTALNFANAKNQIGSFYPANEVFLIKELLFSQPKVLAFQALSEMYKIILIDGEFNEDGVFSTSENDYEHLIWKFLNPCIEGKYKIIQADPFETLGIRQLLNLGHTFGHIVESHFSLSHGESVARGLLFALSWSELKYANKKLTYYRQFFEKLFSDFLKNKLDKIPKDKFIQIALKDKKLNEAKNLNFVFIRDRGDCLIENVTIDEFLNEASRQGVTSDE